MVVGERDHRRAFAGRLWEGQFASEVVWARLTQGEHILAPRVIEQLHAGGDPTWGQRRANM